uniref:Uncharacterized protein n=1 Tax=Aegilops tauschii TaxID=37682 RepID=M8CTL8_AEGTA
MASVARNTMLLLVLVGVFLQLGSVEPAGRMLAGKVAGGGGGGAARILLGIVDVHNNVHNNVNVQVANVNVHEVEVEAGKLHP